MLLNTDVLDLYIFSLSPELGVKRKFSCVEDVAANDTGSEGGRKGAGMSSVDPKSSAAEIVKVSSVVIYSDIVLSCGGSIV